MLLLRFSLGGFRVRVQFRERIIIKYRIKIKVGVGCNLVAI